MSTWFRSLWYWFVGGVWQVLEIQADEALECCKLNLMGDSGQTSEEHNVDYSAAGKDQAQEISTGKKDSICRCTPDHVYYALVENLSAFGSCPETLPETD